MQFVMLVYQGSTPLPGTPEWDNLARPEQARVYADYAALNQDESVKSGPPLGLPEHATTVRVDNGSTLTADGPYVGGEGAVGGYFLLDADDLAAAVAVAARVPAARLGGAVEVRPCAKYW